MNGQERDAYAKGMVDYGDEQLDCTPAYDRFQFDLFRGYLGGKVLEVGAGAGRMTKLALDDNRCKEVVALEPSRHFFGVLQRRLGCASRRLTLLQMETGDLRRERPEYFDCVYSVHVLEHIFDDRRCLEDMLALTKVGGTVIILVPALQWLYSELDRNIGHFRRYDKATLRHLAAGLNVRVERLFYSNLLGVAGSLMVSKCYKLDYQKSGQHKMRFFRLYGIFSRYVVPVLRVCESRMPVPIGLNLTLVLRKTAEPVID